MDYCDKCHKKIEELPFHCKYCGNYFCSTHRLPEDHNCPVLKRKNEKAREKWGSTIKYELRSGDVSNLIKKNRNGKNHQKRLKKITSKTFKKNLYSEGYAEMYVPSFKLPKFHFKNPLKDIFSFNFSYELKNSLIRLIVIFFIGIILNYIYYQNFSIRYLFVGGVQEWFNILRITLNYGLNEIYDLIYLIINGAYYCHLFSALFRLFYEVITNLNKKSTWGFLILFGSLVLIIFKYFPWFIY